MTTPQIKMGHSIVDYHQVDVSPTAMLSPYSTICGRVHIGPEVSVFAGTQIRGDCEPIRIGAKTDIQENCCLHVSMGSELVVGDHVVVGHSVTLHGCTIEGNSLVGMGSTVMDGAVIGRDSIVAAGSLVTQGKTFPPRSLIMGRPARVVRELTDQEVEEMITIAADAYVEVARSMTADGLMVNPPMGTNVWPVPCVFDSLANGGMIFGGMF